MTTRARPSRGERRSWREQDAPLSRPLLYYRRIVATLACLLLIGLFIALIILFWPTSETWSSKHLFIADYDRDSAPPLNVIEQDREALRRAFPTSIDVVQAGTGADLLPDGLKELGKQNKGEKGPLLVYVAGHGCSIGDEAFLLASDFDPAAADSPGINVKELLAAIARHPSQQTLVILDSGPVERDLRVGTAVNRFSEILQREFENSGELKLGAEEELIVLSSHQMWERSFVSPRENRSVFGFYVAEALTSPTANADRLRFDGTKANGKITLAEFAAHVQRGVSAWVWEASQHARTQRPLLLYARGSQRQQVDLVHEPKPGVSQSGATKIAARLNDIVLPDLVAKSAGEGISLLSHFESTAYGQEAPPAARDAAAAQPAAADASAADSKNSAEAAKSKTVSQPQPAAPAPDLRPDWLKTQAALVQSAFEVPVEAGGNWTAADYDPLSVRRSLRYLLHAQQLSLAHEDASFVGSDDPQSPEWHPLTDWQANAQTQRGLRDAARVRNATLLRLQAYVNALDAAEMLAYSDRQLLDDLQLQWREVLRATMDLCESLEQEEYIDLRTAEGQTIADEWSMQNEPSSVAEIQSRGKRLREASTALEQRLRSLLLSKTATRNLPLHAAAWLAQWDLAQSVPLGLWDPVDVPNFAQDASIPLLGLNATQNAASGKAGSGDKNSAAKAVPLHPPALPNSSEIEDEVNLAAQQRRTRWLTRQTALANLLLAGNEAARPITSQGGNAEELNQAALEIAERHKRAVTSLTSTLGTRASVSADWQADRVLRLALLADREGVDWKRLPFPLNLVKRTEQQYLLRLEGPPEEMALAWGQEREVEWKIRHGTEETLNLSRARVALTIDDALLVSHAQQGPLRSGEFSLAELADERGEIIRLTVRASREMEASEATQREATIKPLNLVLSLDPAATSKRQARSTARFQLPAAPVLDVVVTGYAGTMQLAGEENLGGSGASQKFRLNPPPASPDEASGGISRSRVAWKLRPMPQGETFYQLAAVNRSLTSREVVANWHVLESEQPVLDWQTMERQIGDARPKYRSEPTRLEPGKPWIIPLFPAPMMPASAAGAAPPPMAPAKPPDPLRIENGLVCKLTDTSDEQWVQWIWITARPRHPATYVLADPPQYVLGESGAVVQMRLRAAPQSIDLLPTGRKTAISGNAGGAGSRVVFAKKVVEALATSPAQITAEVPATTAGASSLIPFSLDVDGYPRALRFVADAAARQAAEDRSPAVSLRLLQIADPPMPGKEDAPLARSALFFQKAPKLRYELEAEFPKDAGRYVVRLMRDDTVSDRLQTFYFDRDFQIECRPLPPEETGKWNLALASSIRELAGPLDWLTADDYPPPRRLKLRAEILSITDDGQEQPLKPAVQDELTIILDNEPPTIVQRPAATLDWRKTVPPQPLPVIEFSLSDGDEVEGASGIAEVMWGTMRKGDSDLTDGKPLSLSPIRVGAATKLRFAVPQAAMPQEGKSVEILVMARDRAGNVFGPEKLQTINVTLPKRKIDNPKGSDKAK